MGRYLSDDYLNRPLPSYLGQPAGMQVNPGEAAIEAERAAQNQMVQQQEEQQSMWSGFFNGAIEKLDSFYKEYESNLTLGVDAVSSLTSGRDMISVEDSYKVSPGQALEASVQALWDPEVDLGDQQWRESKWGASNRNPLDDDFSVNLVSGALDFAVDWYLDPTVLLGKASKVLRFGTRFTPGGLTHRLTTGKGGAKIVEDIGNQIDQAITDPTINRGTVGKINVLARDLAAGDYNYALGVKEFRGANQGALATAASMINDEETMKIFLGAMTGSQRHIDQLARVRNDLYTDFMKLGNKDLYERLAAATPESKMPVVLDEFLEPGSNVIKRLDDMAANDEAFAGILKEMGYDTIKGVEAAERLVTEFGGSPLIRDWRGRSAKVASMRSARLQRNLEKKRNMGTTPGAWEYIYKDKFGIPTRIWSSTKNFLVGKEANGIVVTRGPESGRGFVEIEAALSDSPMLRMDGGFKTEAMEIWGRAITPDEKYKAIREIENLGFDRMIRNSLNDSEYGRAVAQLSPEEQRKVFDSLSSLKDDMYAAIDKRRADLVNSVRNDKRAYATMVDPDDGTQIVLDARLRSQLSVAEPMLDMKALQKTAQLLVREFGKQYDRYAKVPDVGITGAAGRVVPVVPRFDMSLQAIENTLDTGLSLWKASVLIRLGYTQRNLTENWLRSMATVGLLPMVSRIPGGITRSGINTTKRTGRYLFDRPYKIGDKTYRTNTWTKRANEEAEKIANLKARIEEGQLGLTDELAEANAALENWTRKSEWVNRTLHTGDPIPWFGTGGKINVGSRSFAAFDDPIYRELTSMSSTNNKTLNALVDGEADLTLSQRNYVLVQPGEPQYWDELKQAGIQFKNDEVASRLLAGEDPLKVADWMKSRQARFYRDDMKTPIRAVDDYVAQMDELVSRYLPSDQAKRLVMEDATPAQLKAELGDRLARGELSGIHGRDVMRMTGASDRSVLRRATDRIFYVLGDLPESHLSRQPYYDTMWRREFNSRVAIAKSEGRELSDDVLDGINRAAKQQALRDLKETLYTIENYSTMAKYLRFVIPFFPAFQNSITAWSKIAARDPSIVPRADILWNIPNTLGMVVDENGNTVPYNRYGYLFGGDKDHWVIMPSVIRDWTIDKFGLPMDIPQASFNVVFPGETPYLPGFGPLIGIPANMFLKNKPDVQVFLKKYLGETLYKQVIPFGRTNPNDWELLAPSGFRKIIQFMGKEGNEAYLGISGAVMRDEHMRWMENGGDPDDKYTAQDIINKTDSYYLLSIAASYLGPVSVSPGSQYDIIVNYWRQLSEDPKLSYDDRIQKIERKFGPNAAVMVTSTSQNVPGVANTYGEWSVQKQNKDLARTLAMRGPEFVGMISAGVGAEPFDQGVYTAMGLETVPGTNMPYRRKSDLNEMETKLTMGQAWREYRQAKDARDAALAQMGVSINSNAAAGIKQAWDQFKGEYMQNKYGDVWATQINTWSQNEGVNLLAIQDVLSDQKFMEQNAQNPLWVQVGQYMAARRAASQAIAAGGNSEAIKNAWAEYREQVRYSSLLFSDFFDYYLEGDEDLQQYVGVE